MSDYFMARCYPRIKRALTYTDIIHLHPQVLVTKADTRHPHHHTVLKNGGRTFHTKVSEDGASQPLRTKRSDSALDLTSPLKDFGQMSLFICPQHSERSLRFISSTGLSFTASICLLSVPESQATCEVQQQGPETTQTSKGFTGFTVSSPST